MTNGNTIGRKIREKRKEMHLTQKELAKRAGIAEITLRQYEKGLYVPKMESRIAICNALGCPYSDIFGDVPSSRYSVSFPEYDKDGNIVGFTMEPMTEEEAKNLLKELRGAGYSTDRVLEEKSEIRIGAGGGLPPDELREWFDKKRKEAAEKQQQEPTPDQNELTPEEQKELDNYKKYLLWKRNQ